MRPLKNLPENYRIAGKLDLSRNQRALLWLNLFGLFLVVISGGLFIALLFWLRPQDAIQILSGPPKGITAQVILGAAIITTFILMVILHEAVHGLFFWITTGAKPCYGFKGVYAYAAAPGWYLPRGPYLLTCLAPLFILTPVGITVLALAPQTWLVPALFFLAMHTGGAGGDLYVAAWLLGQPDNLLAQDEGDSFTLYLPE